MSHDPSHGERRYGGGLELVKTNVRMYTFENLKQTVDVCEKRKDKIRVK
jgi:hypothetical protein